MRTFTTNEYKNSPLYQNNPGNLPNKGEDWGGKVPKALRKGNDKYEEFITVEYGLRALMINIRTIMDKGKRNTILEFSHRFHSAAGTQKVALYQSTLSKALGVDKNKRITAFTKDFYIKMAKAIASIEMGSSAHLIPEDAYDTAYIYMGINMTSGGNPVMPENKKPANTPPNKPSGGNTQQNGGNKQGDSTPQQGGGNQQGNTQQGGNNFVDPNLQDPYPTDPNSGQGSNVFLWVGVAIVVGTGGYLLYDHYAQKGKKK